MSKLVVSGGTGLVGRWLGQVARAAGHEVLSLSRRAGPGAAAWDPAAAARGEGPALDALARALEGADVLVNLAGSSLVDGRLGAGHREQVLRSRLDATRALVLAHQRCARPPGVLLSGSAVGYYGDTGEAEVDEDSPPGRDFLAEVCQRWEGEARQLEPRARVVLVRIGLVLAPDAPAWEKLRGPLRLGLGGPLGSGRQWWSWIDARDLARAILFLAGHTEARGPFNLVAPEPVRQADLVRQAALLMGRPAFLPVPRLALRLALGGVADALLLASCRATPRRLLELGFAFERPTLGAELVALVG
jgi:hypothetical protein